MKILEDAGWYKLGNVAFAYRKNDFYILHTKGVHPSSMIAYYHPWILEKAPAYYLIQVGSEPKSKVLNSSPDLKELITIVKLMGLL